jgi:apolipoprotein N-acyltransferase
MKETEASDPADLESPGHETNPAGLDTTPKTDAPLSEERYALLTSRTNDKAERNPTEGKNPTPTKARAGFWVLAFWVVVAGAAFHVAYAFPQGGFLVLFYLVALVKLALAGTWRRAFYAGLAVGFVLATVRLAFFWRIFSAGAIALWYVYAFWIGLFTALAGICLRRLPSRAPAPAAGGPGRDNVAASAAPVPGHGVGCLFHALLGVRYALLVPFLWCGLEYFRSELYYLRFSWLSPGFAFSAAPWAVPLSSVGAYGLSFLLMCIACAAVLRWPRSRVQSVAVALIGAGVLGAWGAASGRSPAMSEKSIRIAGVQMECPTDKEVVGQLDALVHKHPQADLLVLSEYTFTGPVPQKVIEWCRERGRYLVVGGEDPLPGGKFYNTAFVISPAGEIVFRQVKSVPIQFFKDGLPAPEQKIWGSPWGKIGFCICYDLSYSRVTDRLVRLGAQALIAPTMDVEDWGPRQHELHARVAPVRAAEYGIPIFRLTSSGISQAVAGDGSVLASAPCPGYGAALSAQFDLPAGGRLPLDRWLAPLATGLTVAMLLWLMAARALGHWNVKVW